MDLSSTITLSNVSTSSGSDVGFYGGRKISISSDSQTKRKSRKTRKKYLADVVPPPTLDEPEFYPLEPRNTKGDNSRQRRQRKQQTVYLIPSPMAYTPSTKLTTQRAPVPCLYLTSKRFQPMLSPTKSDIRPAVDRHRSPGPASY